MEKKTVDFTQYIEQDMKQKKQNDDTKKGGQAKKGTFSDYTHFVSFPLIDQKIKDRFFDFGVSKQLAYLKNMKKV